jgi:hypothetical protein
MAEELSMVVRCSGESAWKQAFPADGRAFSVGEKNPAMGGVLLCGCKQA